MYDVGISVKHSIFLDAALLLFYLCASFVYLIFGWRYAKRQDSWLLGTIKWIGIISVVITVVIYSALFADFVTTFLAFICTLIMCIINAVTATKLTKLDVKAWFKRWRG